MKGFIEEYGKIIVVIILTLLMLGFGQTGLAKPLQNSLLKSTGMITNAHNKFDEVTKEPETVTPGTSIDIEGVKYIVLEEHGNNQALVMTANSIGKQKFQQNDRKTNKRPDGQNSNTYEGSEIDNYLETEWYNSLSSTMKMAIQQTNIKQTSYTFASEDNFEEQEIGPNGQVYNTISRHAFLPSVGEISKVVDLKNEDDVKGFLNGVSIWTRSGFHSEACGVVSIHYEGYIDLLESSEKRGVRPTFVIDLSKIDYKTVGHTDYK